jgi:hypothetical protein
LRTKFCFYICSLQACSSAHGREPKSVAHLCIASMHYPCLLLFESPSVEILAVFAPLLFPSPCSCLWGPPPSSSPIGAFRSPLSGNHQISLFSELPSVPHRSLELQKRQIHGCLAEQCLKQQFLIASGQHHHLQSSSTHPRSKGFFKFKGLLATEERESAPSPP